LSVRVTETVVASAACTGQSCSHVTATINGTASDRIQPVQ
jgi:hypothetical protein